MSKGETSPSCGSYLHCHPIAATQVHNCTCNAGRPCEEEIPPIPVSYSLSPPGNGLATFVGSPALSLLPPHTSPSLHMAGSSRSHHFVPLPYSRQWLNPVRGRRASLFHPSFFFSSVSDLAVSHPHPRRPPGFLPPLTCRQYPFSGHSNHHLAAIPVSACTIISDDLSCAEFNWSGSSSLSATLWIQRTLPSSLPS